MTDIFSQLGRWWADLLLAHPLATGLWIVGFGLGWILQQATKTIYPDFATRPTWARWFVAVGDVLTTDIVNIVLRRWPTKSRSDQAGGSPPGSAG